MKNRKPKSYWLRENWISRKWQRKQAEQQLSVLKQWEKEAKQAYEEQKQKEAHTAECI